MIEGIHLYNEFLFSVFLKFSVLEKIYVGFGKLFAFNTKKKYNATYASKFLMGMPLVTKKTPAFRSERILEN